MEKKKMKLWKKILIIILIFVALFMIITVRKIVILKNLQSKMQKYANEDNYYAMIYQYQGDSIQIMKSYKKGDRSLSIAKVLNENGMRTLKNYTEGKTSHLYIEVPENKIAILNGNGVPDAIQITNELYIENMWQLIVRAIKSSIKTEKCNGKDCYKVQIGCFDENVVCYFDKNTGLKVREFNGTINDGDNKINIVSDYNYEFGVVKEGDLKEPNISEYVIQEN